MVVARYLWVNIASHYEMVISHNNWAFSFPVYSSPPSASCRGSMSSPAALCDRASRWYHNSHGFHAQR